MKPLAEYKRKRDFKKTPEPADVTGKRKGKNLIFVVQEHHASHLHYDFRLEWDGVLKSWAIPKGPSLDPAQKRLAVEVEDHPLNYAKFTGTIPKGEYGGGEVYRWDYGTWTPLKDAAEGLRKGRLEFTLKGDKLKGDFVLVRTGRASSKPNWLLIKRHDRYAKEGEIKPAAKAPGKRSSKKSAALPPFILPQLALLTDHPPEGEDWVHEIKYDGYRTLAYCDGAGVRLLTRSGKDWTEKYPSVARALKKMGPAVLDGEICSLEPNGKTNFQDLQKALKTNKAEHLVYYVFDLLFADGKDLRSLPLTARKDRLEKLLKGLKSETVRFSEHFRGRGGELMEHSCRLDLEGVISKRVDTPYVSGRHDDWRKSKCIQRQEFVIGGFSDEKGSRSGFGALLLGVYDGTKLRYTGRVGTGFDAKLLKDISAKLKKIETKTSPYAIQGPKGRDIHWVKPSLVAEIKFTEWTSEGSLRHPVFQGLRADKKAEDVVQEKAKSLPSISKTAKATKIKPKKRPTPTLNAIDLSDPGPLKLTHPDKIVYPKEKITKLQVAQYYDAVAPWMLPFIANRPLSLVRCPQGAGKPCFFSKHFAEGVPDGLLTIPNEKGKPPWVALDSIKGLRACIQRGTLEIHPWGSRTADIEAPDQIIMDFDPDPSVDFAAVKAGALELKDMLDQLKLESFLKVTGGKGLHVQFPFAPIYAWEQVKEFSKTLVQEMVHRHPELYTVNIAKKSRVGKIFIDYLRNGRGATAVAPYSLRTHAVTAVAMPIAWSDLKKLKSANLFTMDKALAHLEARRKDPWADYAEVEQEISILKGKR